MGEFVSDLSDRIRDWVSGLHFSSVHKRSLVVISLLVVLVSMGVVYRGHSEPIAQIAPIVIAPPKVIVDVAGGVNSPGVYSLPTDSRVMDAIIAAGGAQKGTDTSDINLARIVKDGEQIYVEPSLVQRAVSGGAPAHVIKKKSWPININRATVREFDTLPGIGPVLASRIVDYRKMNGPFSTVEDLQKVSGIGSAKFTEFKNKVRV